MPAANNEYKDRLFTFIFGNNEHRDWTLELYNAINGTAYADPSAISITTIREVLYLGMHNDTSFLLADEVNLYEQQSTYNPNMPLRMLQYIGSLYEKYIKEHRLNKYGRKLLMLPAPRLVVFYNGATSIPSEVTLRLSDSFPKGKMSDIEVTVRMVNINPGESPLLENRCQPLYEYTWTVERIRENMATMEALHAIDEALEGMPESFVIKPFLMAHKAEVRDMLLTEYNEAEAMELFREDGREEGRVEGRAETITVHAARVMDKLGLSAEQALDLLGIPEEERGGYLETLRGTSGESDNAAD
ncbi:MAG: hypothetical protein J6D34_01650 [Atopobiaceae bacterium]|nr:hypothetical protein [Atopobiaceae bacterium]